MHIRLKEMIDYYFLDITSFSEQWERIRHIICNTVDRKVTVKAFMNTSHSKGGIVAEYQYASRKSQQARWLR